MSARRAAVAAPAKVNLGLRIVGRRDDGYHELESVFLPLDLADEVAVAVEPADAPAVAFHLESEAGSGGAAPAPQVAPAGADNLAARAAQAFLAAAELSAAVEVRLTKRIPVAAGLGGGSSDAAAVLRALASLFPDALPEADLAGLALGLGADVPFFLDPRPARVRGIGERIEPLADLPPLALLLANPGIPLPTAEVYRAFDALHRSLTPEGPPSTLPDLPGLALDNDLEPAAIRLCPPIARLRDRIRETDPLGVAMSGSGPTVFGVYPSREAAEAARDAASLGPPVWVRVASGIRVASRVGSR